MDNSSSIELILDSEFTLAEALIGQKIPASVKTNLTLVNVFYYGFDEKLHHGQLVVLRANKCVITLWLVV